jgi:hypothetical protein
MKIKKQNIFIGNYVIRALLIVVLVSLFIFTNLIPVSAADLQNRTIIIQDSEPSVTTRHTFSFINPTSSSLGSIKFEYCINSPLFSDICTPPPGLDVSAVGIFSQTGNVGFSVSGVTNANTIVLTRAASVVPTLNSAYAFSNVVNPNLIDTTYYVRISMHASIDGTGASFDQGAVAFSINSGLTIGVFVPPFLTFCVGVTVSSNCSSATGNLVSFGELSDLSTSAATTQFAAATNDVLGLSVFMNGQTMTSGNNVIPGLSTRTVSQIGVSQFGINLVANSTPSIGSNRTGVGSTNATADYGASNQYKFANGNLIARSTIPTDFNVFTVSYITNVSNNQNPGVYASTLIYTAVASF